MFLLNKKYSHLLYGCVLVLVMLLGRVILTHRFTYLFLAWNLFLAYLPLAIAYYSQKHFKNGWLLLLQTAAWLVLFPNAPYIITDLYHLAHFVGMPIGYDALMLFTAAFTGLCMGFHSLQIMEKCWRQLWKNNRLASASTLVRWRFRLASVVIVFLLTGFGIYLGRVLRWNSWNVVLHADKLAYDIAVRIINPIDYYHTWAFTLIYGVVLFFLYHAWSKISDNNRSAL